MLISGEEGFEAEELCQYKGPEAGGCLTIGGGAREKQPSEVVSAELWMRQGSWGKGPGHAPGGTYR